MHFKGIYRVKNFTWKSVLKKDFKKRLGISRLGKIL
jgi:hypothetical protein